MTQLKAQAIQTALVGDWANAITLNQTLLEENPDDIDTLNRLAFAYSSLGNSKEAKSIYQKVLSLDNQNPIALRNLKRLNGGSLPSKNSAPLTPAYVSNLFIEEPGKTKIIELLNVADKKVITPLRSGELVQLVVKRMKIFVLDQNKQYLGMLPDDIGRRLLRFIEGGNIYEAYIKSVEDNKVTIFAREVKQNAKFKNQPSFLSTDRAKLLVTKSTGKSGKKNDEDDYDNEDSDDHSSDEE